ncbi:MAG: sigma-70 family RNA polymerase sigma factor [Phycisphaerae bacterium]|nr:sigma-70 family RNA polymerase sigma factor [Phycisphaerae bacterium]
MSQCEQNHDEDRSRALAKIYREYDRFIQSVIQFSAKNQADREDIYQEVFIVLFQKADLDQIQDFKSYLYRLVINKSNEFLRKKISREIQLKEYIGLQSPEAVQEGGDMQDMLILEEVDSMVDLIKECLSQRESEAILLRFKSHYDNEEAARKMGVQKETLIRYVSVGLKKLRDIIKSIRRAEK